MSSLLFAAADSIMKVASNAPLLSGGSTTGDTATSGGTVTNLDGLGKEINTVANNIYLAFKNYILPILLTALLIVAVVLGIIKGIKLAKAESADQQQEAKKSLITFLIGIGSAILVVALVMILMPTMASWLGVSLDVNGG